MKLDLNVMLPTVRQVRLFTALEHIYNRALNDFATPISDVASAIILGLGFHAYDSIDATQLLPSLGAAPQQSNDGDAFGLQRGPEEADADMEEERVVIGARLPALSATDKVELAFSLFLYMDYAFTGRWFPRGNDLPDLWFSGAKAQLLSVLFTQSAKLTAKKNTAPIPLPSYPWLSFFLNVSCRHTLSAVAMAFDSQDWTVYIDQWSGEEDKTEQQGGGHTATALAIPTDVLPAIPIPEGESLPEEFLNQQQQQQQQSSDAFGDTNGAVRGMADGGGGEAGVVRLTASGVPSRQLMLDALTLLIIDQKQAVPSEIAQSSNQYNPHPCLYQAKPSDSVELLQFAAKYVGRGVVQASASLLNRTFASLTDVADIPADTAEGKKERTQRETLLVTLLGRCGSGYDYENLLVRCQQARFFNVCVFLYKKRKDFPRILQYYIAGIDAAAQSHTASATEDSSLFEFICSAIADATAGGHTATLQQLRSAVLDRLPDLVRADPLMTAKVIVQHFSRDNDKVIAALDSVPELQYQYLRAIMAGAKESLDDMQQQQRASGMAKSTSTSSSLSASAAGSVPASPSSSGSLFLSGGFGNALAETSQSSMSDLLQRAGMSFSPRMHEQYVRLLCQFDPQAVLPHLTSHMDYSIEAVLRLCQERGIDDASAYLLERTGDVSGALELMLRSVDKHVADLRVYVEAHWQEYETIEAAAAHIAANNALHSAQLSPSESHNRSSAASSFPSASSSLTSAARRQSVSASGMSALESSPGYLTCHKLVLDAIGQASHLCQRSGAGDGEKLWFILLDRFVQLQRQLKVSQQQQPQLERGKASAIFPPNMQARPVAYMHQALIGYVRSVLRSMMGHVRLPVILRKITTDHQADELREFRDTIVSMLDTYSYERSILQTATALLNADKYMQIERLAAKHASAFTARADYCEACHLPLADGSITLRITVFDCQHAFHDSCLRQHTTACPLCQQQNNHSGKKPRKDATNRSNTDGQQSEPFSHTDNNSSNSSNSQDGSEAQHSSNADGHRDEGEKTSKVTPTHDSRCTCHEPLSYDFAASNPPLTHSATHFLWRAATGSVLCAVLCVVWLCRSVSCGCRSWFRSSPWRRRSQSSTAAAGRLLDSTAQRAAADTYTLLVAVLACMLGWLCRAEGVQVGLEGFHALVSALSTSAKDDNKEGADEAVSSSAAALHPKFTAGSLMPLPNNLPRLVQAKGTRRGENKSNTRTSQLTKTVQQRTVCLSFSSSKRQQQSCELLSRERRLTRYHSVSSAALVCFQTTTRNATRARRAEVDLRRAMRQVLHDCQLWVSLARCNHTNLRASTLICNQELTCCYLMSLLGGASLYVCRAGGWQEACQRRIAPRTQGRGRRRRSAISSCSSHSGRHPVSSHTSPRAATCTTRDGRSPAPTAAHTVRGMGTWKFVRH